MGLWSSMCEVASNICSSISSGISKVCSFISNNASSISLACKVAAEGLSLVFPQVKAVGVLCNVLQCASKVTGLIATICGVLKPNETVEQIGDEALQAEEEGITPSEFENFDEYMESLRNFKLDPEKSKKYKTEEKLAAGKAVIDKALTNKFGKDLDTSALLFPICASIVGKNKELENYITNPERLKKWTELAKDGKISFKDVSEYLMGTNNNLGTRVVLEKTEQSLRPNDPYVSIAKQIKDIKEQIQKISEKFHEAPNTIV